MNGPVTIVGYMGSGKSTLGRALARRLGWEFVDLDEEIVRSENRSIPRIFAESGEERFRELEHRELSRSLDGPPERIVACGGGVVLREDNRELLANTATIFLEESLSVLYERTRNDGRPLRGTDSEQFERRYTERLPLYRAVTDVEVFVQGRPPHEVLEEVLEWVSA